ncbi:MAG TPA: CAP domain-containing protein [Solirubrobacteraceae bacterium]|nr:CAP domain-containing protein [Solirubrobacteraceae bacterium]
MNATSSFKLRQRPASALAAATIAILAALGACGEALAAHASHHQRSTRHCSTRRAHHTERCGRAARYRASHRRHAGSPRRNRPLKVPDARVQKAPAASALSASPAMPETCANTELVPTSSNIAEVRAATLCLINRERIQNGERPLVENQHLLASAQGHSEDMVSRDYFSHTTPTGEAFDTRILATGYVRSDQLYELGENIDCATLTLATPAATVNAWMNSPEHRENILNGEYRETGMGVVAAAPAYFAGDQAGATYTQDFGVIG